MSVSVIIAAFNAAEVIGRALESALSQTHPAAEVIIVDDASTDNTCELVNGFAKHHPNVRLISLASNGGPSHARNVGLANATGTWVAILDADDAWKPERLEKLVAIAEEDSLDAVGDNQRNFDAVAKVESSFAFSVDWQRKVISAQDLFESDIFRTSQFSYGLLKLLIRREALERAGLRYNEEFRYGEDFHLLAEMLFQGFKVEVISDAYYIYTSRFGQKSKTTSPFSKSSPRFDLLVAAGEALQQKYGHLISPSFAAVIQRRQKEKQLIHMSNESRPLRQSGHYLKYARYLLKNPDLVFLLARQRYLSVKNYIIH